MPNISGTETGHKFYQFKNVTDDSADIYFYGEIGESWYDEASKGAKQFIDELAELNENATLNIHFNSPGGNVFDGVAISTAIKQHSGKTVAYIDALAASAASFIALSCNEVYIADLAAIMIHRASVLGYGNVDDFKKIIDLLDSIDASIASTYARFDGEHNADYWYEQMSAESWYFGQAAVDAGLADELFAAEPIAACITPEVIAKYGYKHVPQDIVADSESDATSIINNVEEAPEEDTEPEGPVEEVIEQDDNAPRARLISFSNQNIIVHRKGE